MKHILNFLHLSCKTHALQMSGLIVLRFRKNVPKYLERSLSLSLVQLAVHEAILQLVTQRRLEKLKRVRSTGVREDVPDDLSRYVQVQYAGGCSELALS